MISACIQEAVPTRRASQGTNAEVARQGDSAWVTVVVVN